MKAETATLIEGLNGLKAETAIVLGSGLGGLVDRIENPFQTSLGSQEKVITRKIFTQIFVHVGDGRKKGIQAMD